MTGLRLKVKAVGAYNPHFLHQSLPKIRPSLLVMAYNDEYEYDYDYDEYEVYEDSYGCFSWSFALTLDTVFGFGAVVGLVIFILAGFGIKLELSSLQQYNWRRLLPGGGKSQHSSKREQTWNKIYRIKARNAAIKRFQRVVEAEKDKPKCAQPETLSSKKVSKVIKNKGEQQQAKKRSLRPPPPRTARDPTLCQPVSTEQGLSAISSPPSSRPFPNAWTDRTLEASNNMIPCHEISQLPESDHASRILKRLAKEFEPIVRQRGYNVAYLAEFCCCGMGTRTWDHQCQIQLQTANIQRWQGYNQTRTINGSRVNEISIRLRHQSNHYRFIGQKALVDTMCHELAHCVHMNHGPAFWKLYRELKLDYQILMASGTVQLTNEDLFGEFNIYGSSVSGLGRST